MISTISIIESIFRNEQNSIHNTKRQKLIRLTNDFKNELLDEIPHTNSDWSWYKQNLNLLLLQIKATIPVYFEQRIETLNLIDNLIDRVRIINTPLHDK